MIGEGFVNVEFFYGVDLCFWCFGVFVFLCFIGIFIILFFVDIRLYLDCEFFLFLNLEGSRLGNIVLLLLLSCLFLYD